MNKKIFLSVLVLPLTILVLAFLIIGLTGEGRLLHQSLADERQDLIKHQKAIISRLITKGDYACCLKEPCSYCIEENSKHGVGASCECLKDVVEGHHPCGECMGEILEGHGNPYLSKYFAPAIADEVGTRYLDTLDKIMADKYNLEEENKIQQQKEGTCDFKQTEGCKQK